MKLQERILAFILAVFPQLLPSTSGAQTVVYTDLHPAGVSASYAYAMSGNQQAGDVYLNGPDHAAIWSGTAASFVDLHPARQLLTWLQGQESAPTPPRRPTGVKAMLGGTPISTYSASHG